MVAWEGASGDSPVFLASISSWIFFMSALPVLSSTRILSLGSAVTVLSVSQPFNVFDILNLFCDSRGISRLPD